MRLQQSLGLTALTSALAANAFLLPSSLSWGPASDHSSVGNLDYGSHLTSSSTTKTRTLKLACPGCSFPEAYGKEYGDPKDEEDVSNNSILLTFAVSGDGHTLLLNNEPLYPLDISIAKSHSLYAQQVPSTVSFTGSADHTHSDDLLSRPRQLFYTESARSTDAADGSDASITDIDLQIDALDNENVNVDRLTIRLLGDEDGKLNIVDIINVPLDHTKPAYDSSDPSSKSNANGDYEMVCEGPLAAICRVRAFMEDRLNAMRHKIMKGKPCASKMQMGHHKSHDAPTGAGALGHIIYFPGGNRVPIHGGVDKFRPYFPDASSPSTLNTNKDPLHHHRHSHWRHRTVHVLHMFTRLLHRVFVGFFIPVLIGIAAGVVASVLGMCVGTIVAWLWIKLVRGGKRGNASRARRIVLEGEQRVPYEGDKTALMQDIEGSRDEEEAPPCYVEKE